jgi:predicted nucleic acid-binding protein
VAGTSAPARSTATPSTSESVSIFTLDTNILVYSIDLAAGSRHELAKDIVTRASVADCCLTLQSISEFYAVTTRKGMMQPREAASLAEAMLDLFPTAPASPTAVRSALAIAASGRASYWNALLIATAAEAGCTAILTEDLGGAASLAGVQIINPFAGTTLSPAAAALLRAG